MSNPFHQILLNQQAYFNSIIRHKSLWERKQTLRKLLSWVKKNQQLIIDEVGKDFSKCPEDVMLSEIKPVVDEIKHAVRYLRFWAEEEKKSAPLAFFGTRAKVVKEPKGVCLIIAPWNFPFQLAISPLVSALAAGNCAVVKPSEMTPFCEQLIKRMIAEVFEPNHVSCVTGGVQETTELLRLKWDHIFFTGSPQVGKIIMKAAAEHLTSVTLELGGKNPVIIDKTANLKDAAIKLIWGKYFNNGQSCVSPNYIFVEKSVYEKFCQYAVLEHRKRFGKEGTTDPTYGRIVNAHHFGRVSHLLDDAKEKGATVIAGGNKRVEDNFLAPTIICNISKEAKVMQEEIFGPILPILCYTSLQEVTERIVKDEKPLAIYVFSKSSKTRQFIERATSSGALVFNDTTIQFSHPNLPFGGVNNSGIGKAHGKYGFDEFTNHKAIIKQRVGMTSAKLIYPPYTGIKRFIIKAVTWWV
jgi:aldehyde dehydrogenase (NAD+)